MCIIQLFCDIDDFFIEYEQQMASKPLPDTETSKKRNRPAKLHKSEVMTILVAFHQSGQSTFRYIFFGFAAFVGAQFIAPLTFAGRRAL